MHKKLIYIVVLIVFTILTCFQSVCSQYFYKQKLISLESNDLLSNVHLKVSYSPLSSLTQRVQSALEEESYWMFEMVKTEKQNFIYAISGTNYDDFVLPIKSGLSFEDSNSKEAIIGHKVKTIVTNGKEYIQFNNQDYPVIGRMGMMDPSPLDSMVLINDKNLLYVHERGEVFFDSSNISKLKEIQKEEQLSLHNSGVVRWFDTETYLTFMKWLSLLLCSSIACIIGIAYSNARFPFNTLKYELGLSTQKYIIQDIAFMVVSYLFLLLCFSMIIVQICSFTLKPLVMYSLTSIIMMILGYFLHNRNRFGGKSL